MPRSGPKTTKGRRSRRRRYDVGRESRAGGRPTCGAGARERRRLCRRAAAPAIPSRRGSGTSSGRRRRRPSRGDRARACVGGRRDQHEPALADVDDRRARRQRHAREKSAAVDRPDLRPDGAGHRGETQIWVRLDEAEESIEEWGHGSSAGMTLDVRRPLERRLDHVRIFGATPAVVQEAHARGVGQRIVRVGRRTNWRPVVRTEQVPPPGTAIGRLHVDLRLPRQQTERGRGRRDRHRKRPSASAVGRMQRPTRSGSTSAS